MARPPVLELRGIVKRYPGVVACDGVGLSLHAGEVHALLGENGAGKSTIISLLAGMQSPDAGTMHLDGQAVSAGTPSAALARGIGVVPQHARLVPTLTVAENLLLGGAWWHRPARDAVAARFLADSARLGLAIDPAARAGRLTPGEQLQVAIVQALWRGGRVLALDEPTAPLGPTASAQLLGRLRALQQTGLTILLVTHRLDEALDAADRVTVLRRGRVTGTLDAGALAQSRDSVTARIRAMMFGTDTAPPAAAPARPAVAAGGGLVVAQLSVAGALADVSLSVAPGEILGVAGIDGQGQTALAEALAGVARASGGTITLDGESLDRLDGAARFRRGVRYVSDDRIGEGTVGAFPVALNLLLKRIGAVPFWRHGVQRDATIGAYAAERISEFDIRTPGAWIRLATLSGGNIQKVMLARELDGGHRLVIYHKPTIGLDARAAASVHRRMRRAAADGAISLVISADLDELFLLADRIAVLDRGRIAGIVGNAGDARARVAALLTQ